MSGPSSFAALQSAQPADSLSDALGSLVTYLNCLFPLATWMVTRLTGDHCKVLYVDDKLNTMRRGDILSWASSLCSRMTQGLGPKFAPDAQLVPAYRDAPINSRLRIGAYVGQPLLGEDGVLLGTLCGVDPEARQSFTHEQTALVATLAKPISTLLSFWTKLEKATQTEAELQTQAYTDALTGLANRHKWNLLLTRPEGRHRDCRDEALVLIVDLDGLKEANDRFGHAEGDRYLLRAAQALRELTRGDDVVARIGGDEFAVCMRGVSKELAPTIASRVRNALAQADVQASVGSAFYLSDGSLQETMRVADMRMYEDKAFHKQARIASKDHFIAGALQ